VTSTQERLNAIWFAASMRGATNEDDRVAWAVTRRLAYESSGRVHLTDEGREYADRIISEARSSAERRPAPVPSAEGVGKLVALLGVITAGLLFARRRRR
jgi:MYXO-CTERM domain-containing protein